MKKHIFTTLFCLLEACLLFGGNNLSLWYRQPAANWNEALPLGNGYLGAMVFGDAGREHLQLNESTLYSGEPFSGVGVPSIGSVYNEVLALLNHGDYAGAHRLITRNWQGRLSQSYQPLADLFLSFDVQGKVENYVRELNLQDAVHTIRYQAGGIRYTREYFISNPDRVMVIRISASRRSPVNVAVSYTSEHPTAKVDGTGEELILSGQAPGCVERRTLDFLEKNRLTDRHPELFDSHGRRKTDKQVLYADEVGGKGMFFQSRVKVLKANATLQDNQLKVSGEGEIILLVAAATSYNGFDRSPSQDGSDYQAKLDTILSVAGQLPYEDLKKRHLADYQRLFGRVALTLKSEKDYSGLPTDRRIIGFRDNPDNALAALLFQYGRYLLIASSREGGQPANLQGIWNKDVVPAWSSSYTININTEMNYWPAETTGLPECSEPLFRLIRELAVNGSATAAKMYNLPGWTSHHITSIWRESGPADGEPTWFMWNMSAGWLCRHLWDHYLFSGDKKFLRETAYPLMRDAARFYNAWLVEKDGMWQTPLGVSPENQFLTPEKKTSAVAPAPAMDMAIIRELFSNTAEAAAILAADSILPPADTLLLHVMGAKQLVPYRIGKRGQIMEWSEDFDEVEPHHRHLSHLYGFHPGCEITPGKTPELVSAVRRTLELRGDEATGWSMGWKINMWARMHDGNHAYRIIRNLFTPTNFGPEVNRHGGLYKNLFDAHPPFQIDGNFGYTAGVAEMLLQSHDGVIDILPALPDVWAEGKVTGLRARGGFIIDITWSKSGKTVVKVFSEQGNACRLKIGRKVKEVVIPAGQSQVFTVKR